MKVNEKILSGKFWLAIMAGIVFLLSSTAIYGTPTMSSEAAASIITVVFMNYFKKKDD